MEDKFYKRDNMSKKNRKRLCVSYSRVLTSTFLLSNFVIEKGNIDLKQGKAKTYWFVTKAEKYFNVKCFFFLR